MIGIFSVFNSGRLALVIVECLKETPAIHYQPFSAEKTADGYSKRKFGETPWKINRHFLDDLLLIIMLIPRLADSHRGTFLEIKTAVPDKLRQFQEYRFILLPDHRQGFGSNGQHAIL